MDKNVIVVPKNDEIKKMIIPEGVRLDGNMIQHMQEMYDKNPSLCELVLQDACTANIIASKKSRDEKPFDFSWTEYTLRDVSIHQFHTKDKLCERMRMLELNDVETSKILKSMFDDNIHQYMTLLLYYGAPADSEQAFSHVRFIDVIGILDNDECVRHTFLRYTKEL